VVVDLWIEPSMFAKAKTAPVHTHEEGESKGSDLCGLCVKENCPPRCLVCWNNDRTGTLCNCHLVELRGIGLQHFAKDGKLSIDVFL
jgi:hypothetical protein